MGERKSGILLHITSLPGPDGIGTLGKEAYRFVDFLAETKQKIWQLLPLGPAGFANSPYQCYSAFAGNILLIDLNLLVEDGLLGKNIFSGQPRFNTKKVEFLKVSEWKMSLLARAFDKFRQDNYNSLLNEYQIFLKEHSWWLKDFALFMAAKKHFDDEIWTAWPDKLKYRKPVAMHKYQLLLEEEIEFRKFLQFLFFRQWFNLKNYANSKGVEIIGDLPIYVSTDSADVWTNADIFVLDKKLNPKEVGGVPPDYFSDNGQLWGNPVFNWKSLEKRDFDWWIARLHFNLNLFDKVRIDHFRGLESYWSVPAGENTAKNGRWLPAKGRQVLEMLRSQTGNLPLIAEDLGVITDEVRKLREDFNLPGMKVLQFAFSSDAGNEYLPHNYNTDFLAYTGTHDNDTTLGWMKKATGAERKKAMMYLKGRRKRAQGRRKRAHRNGLEWIWSSVAENAIAPMQDILQLGTWARMNTPGTISGNWEWRFQWSQLRRKHREFLKTITIKYNR